MVLQQRRRTCVQLPNQEFNNNKRVLAEFVGKNDVKKRLATELTEGTEINISKEQRVNFVTSVFSVLSVVIFSVLGRKFFVSIYQTIACVRFS